MSTRAPFVLIGAAVGLYAIDQATKALVAANLTEGVAYPVLGDVLQLRFVRNPGAAFSFLADHTWVFTALSSVVFVVVVALLVRHRRQLRHSGWALIIGAVLAGLTGNLTDRLLQPPGPGVGHVIDFISTPWMMPAIFNVADCCIVLGMIALVAMSLWGPDISGERAERPDAIEEALATVHTSSSDAEDASAHPATPAAADPSPSSPPAASSTRAMP